MKRIFSIFALVAIFGLTSCSDNSEVKSDDPVVKCFNGSFIGYVEDNGVLTFKGIPFAKAPIGELRWKAPQPVEAFKEVFEAKEYGLPGLLATRLCSKGSRKTLTSWLALWPMR